MYSSSATGNDAKKIAALNQFQILDTKPESDFDNIAALAAQICEAPTAIIGFTDQERFWFKARWGTSHTFNEIPGGLAVCRKTISENGIAIINDTLKSDAFRNDQDIQREGIRFIASVPVTIEPDLTLGYLCVFDNTPRTLTEIQVSGLKMLAGQVIALLKLRLQLLKAAEDEYIAAEAQMRTIFYNAIDAVIVTDAEGVIQQWNPKAEEIFGWTEPEISGKVFHNVCIPSRYSATYVAGMNNTEEIIQNESNKTIEIRGITKNDNEFDIALSISPATVQNKTYYICFVSDITNRKAAAKELDNQKEFYENILNNIPTDIAVFDANHKYLFVNPSAIKNKELRQYIIGKDDFEYAKYRNRDAVGAQLRRNQFLLAKETAKEIRWEDNMTNPEGIAFTHLRRMFPVHNENRELTMMIGFGIDITERKEMEEKQTDLLNKLSIQNTQLVDFCNIVSHNLRAPMVNLLLLVEYINDCQDIEEQKALVAEIKPVLDNLNTTFSELVESIQIKNDLETESEKIAFIDCLNRATEGLKTEIQDSNAIIETEFEKEPSILYPSKYLNSIFQNLVSNALKYKSPKRTPHLILKSERNKESIILSITDNGLGIDLKRHGHNIFKMGKTFHPHPHAKGFGLFMVKTHIQAMDGKIEIESELDKGTTFIIEFSNQPVCNL